MTDRSNAGAGDNGEVFGQATPRKKYRLRRRLFSFANNSVSESAHGHHHECCDHDHHHHEQGGDTEQLRQQVNEAREAALRARADLENQRKRHLKEKDDLRKFANESLLGDLVPALDHFALALRSIESTNDVKSLRDGVQMIHREIMGVLQGNGLTEISPLGKPFDPARHEAVATTSVNGQDDNVVVEVMRPGWELNGRVLRPAMVKVNKGA